MIFYSSSTLLGLQTFPKRKKGKKESRPEVCGWQRSAISPNGWRSHYARAAAARTLTSLAFLSLFRIGDALLLL